METLRVGDEVGYVQFQENVTVGGKRLKATCEFAVLPSLRVLRFDLICEN